MNEKREQVLSPEERSFKDFEAAMAQMYVATMEEEEEEEEEEDSKEEEEEEEGKEPAATAAAAGAGGNKKEQRGSGGGGEGKWAAREVAWKRELLAKRGPYLYELFAVLIHSGSALGALVCAYAALPFLLLLLLLVVVVSVVVVVVVVVLLLFVLFSIMKRSFPSSSSR